VVVDARAGGIDGYSCPKYITGETAMQRYPLQLPQIEDHPHNSCSTRNRNSSSLTQYGHLSGPNIHAQPQIRRQYNVYAETQSNKAIRRHSVHEKAWFAVTIRDHQRQHVKGVSGQSQDTHIVRTISACVLSLGTSAKQRRRMYDCSAGAEHLST
jgi:hypothetical protein